MPPVLTLVFSHGTLVGKVRAKAEIKDATVRGLARRIREEREKAAPTPSAAGDGVDREYLAGIINHGERLLVLLNLDTMFSKEE